MVGLINIYLYTYIKHIYVGSIMMLDAYILNFIIICGIVLILDEVSTVPAVNKIENLTAPKFKNLEGMHKTVSKYIGNMMKLKCEAEGNNC